MLVCHCAAVNDAAIEQAIAGGAHSIGDITAACGAGGGCGGCHPVLCRLLRDQPGGTCGTADCTHAALVSAR